MSPQQTQEIEAKLLVQDLLRTRQKLEEKGAKCITPRQFEDNLRLDLPDLSLSREGKVLRLRKFGSAQLTYKADKQLNRGIATRTELEVTVSDFEQTRNILAALGYQPIFVYEKYRAVYQLGNCHIMLDEMPFGHFVEIEGRDGAQITALAENLGLDIRKSIPDSYQVLFLKIKQKLTLGFSDITFENFKNLSVSPADMQAEPADTPPGHP